MLMHKSVWLLHILNTNMFSSGKKEHLKECNHILRVGYFKICLPYLQGYHLAVKCKQGLAWVNLKPMSSSCVYSGKCIIVDFIL